ncbi:hypothetical protein SNOG_13146 [Parastagonospora nodorum SN15]|uniref:Uncharacterized protein n=1 Tax=Phaeosphaeria nodorum (strain SN15 / ATCC MYA-4574 / FGSC 10173) TaxID=321614 RepID=Q0U518_PHANO|nr:hypothetical protein SNOG_13146 [Parastagonospora nodorum SN15]EAT79473.1 hypothetical protein SNOG_13146 [Parastagonospora nodorum SN15]
MGAGRTFRWRVGLLVTGMRLGQMTADGCQLRTQSTSGQEGRLNEAVMTPLHREPIQYGSLWVTLSPQN